MGMMTLQQALGFVRQRIPSAHLVGDGATPLARVHTDTRTLQAGDLFVALKGERFDANAFLPHAQASGAAAALPACLATHITCHSKVPKVGHTSSKWCGCGGWAGAGPSHALPAPTATNLGSHW